MAQKEAMPSCRTALLTERQAAHGFLSATQPVAQDLGKEGGGWSHKHFPKMASGRGDGEEGCREEQCSQRFMLP